jgi:hypothetical protein
MLLLCVKPWDKPFVWQSYIIINLCVLFIIEMLIIANIHIVLVNNPCKTKSLKPTGENMVKSKQKQMLHLKYSFSMTMFLK